MMVGVMIVDGVGNERWKDKLVSGGRDICRS